MQFLGDDIFVANSMVENFIKDSSNKAVLWASVFFSLNKVDCYLSILQPIPKAIHFTLGNRTEQHIQPIRNKEIPR
jgi:hypothetical protein